MIEASNEMIVRGREMPGPGKRTLTPSLSNKKLSKKLASNSKNPLLSTSGNMATCDAWSLLTTPEPEPEMKEYEFVIPPCLEAFAEKIGLSQGDVGLGQRDVGLGQGVGLSQGDVGLGQGQKPDFDRCWADLKTGDTTPVVSSPAPLFHDYAIPTNSIEDVTGFLVSPAEVEGRQLEEVRQTVTKDTTSSSADTDIVKFSEADMDKLEAFLNGTDLMEVENNSPLTVTDQNFDIIEFAMGESGVSLEEITEDSNNTLPVVKEVKLEPVDNVDIEVIDNTRRNKVGRPTELTPIKVTEIPSEGNLSVQELRALKYRRTRDLNNKASRRFREKKKKEDQDTQAELMELQARNFLLKQKYADMEAEVAMWRAKVARL